MNGLERYKGTLNGTAIDIIPRIPILMQFAAEYIGSNYGEFAADYRVLVEANIKCAEDFDFDQVSCISDPYREAQGFGAEVKYVTDGVPRGTHPLAENRDISILAKPDPFSSTRMLDRVNAVREYKKKCGDEYSILGWIEGPAAEAADLRDIINFLMDLMDDEDYACKLMDLSLEVGIEFARAQIEAGADTIGVGDAIASQVSFDTYQRLILPREKILLSKIKEIGAFTRLHICGNITHLLPGIKELDVDILDVDHMVDITTVRKRLGDKVVIAGNIDPASGVLSGTPESIRKTVLQNYKDSGNPFMVNAGCEIPSGTPEQNLKALCEPIPFAK